MALTQIDDRGLKTPIDLLDNEKIRLGTGNDIEFYHDGSNNFIKATNGNTSIIAGQTNINNAADTENCATFIGDGAVNLFYNGNKKFETTSVGVKLLGSGTDAIEMTGDVWFNNNEHAGKDIYFNSGDKHLIFEDEVKAKFGGAGDLEIYHDGSHSYIYDTGTGKLRLVTNSFRLLETDNSTNMIAADENGAVELYYDGSKTFETVSGGTKTTGGHTITSYSGTAGLGQLNFGASGTPNIKAWDTGNHGSGSKLQIRSGDGDTHIECNRDGNVELYYNNSKHFETISNGVKVDSASDAILELHTSNNTAHGRLNFSNESGDNYGGVWYSAGNALQFRSNNAERMRVGHSVASVYIGKVSGEVTIASSEASFTTGCGVTLCGGGGTGHYNIFTSNDQTTMFIGRQSTDGDLMNFRQEGSSEGTIGVSGSTVSYNGGHLSRWSQLTGISSTDKSERPTIYQGTVMSNLDELCSWSHDAVLYTKEDETNGEIPAGKKVGDVKTAAYTEDNQQLNMTKVSDVVGDKNVAGVFWTWDDNDDEIVNDFYVAMTGDMVIRVAASTTVERGDLLISAGDGTAKPQADDIIRSSTIAKIISTNHTATYADGSKAYPCVLMAC